VLFKSPAQQIKHIPLREGRNSPQGPVYAKREQLLAAEYLENALEGSL